MSIKNKIIFSSTFVAILAAFAAYMGWKNTQPIQQSLVLKLTHETEKIRFLDDINANAQGVRMQFDQVARDLINGPILPLQNFDQEENLLKARIKTLELQIKSFTDFDQSEDSHPAIKKLLGSVDSLNWFAETLFKNALQKDYNQIARVELKANRLVTGMSEQITEINKKRFEQIKKEGEITQDRLGNLNFWIILIGGLTCLLALVFGQLIARNLSASLSSLKTAAKKINQGDYSIRVGLKSNDEFGNLRKTFDGMAANLEQASIIEEQTKKLKHLNQELTLKKDSLDTFVYRVSHDLKAPVVNITSLLNLLRTKVDLEQNPQSKQVFGFLTKSTNKLQQTILDLLEVSRIERNLNPEGEWVMIQQVINEVIEEHKEKIDISDVEIKTSLEVSQMFFSYYNLRSILSNLISNGIKYSAPERTPLIEILTEKTNDGVVILQVRDNGIGIDLDRHQEKLYDMFSRFHNHVEGSGVGLYIVKKLVESTGGSIRLESQVNVGTTFTMNFPQQSILEEVH